MIKKLIKYLVLEDMRTQGKVSALIFAGICFLGIVLIIIILAIIKLS